MNEEDQEDEPEDLEQVPIYPKAAPMDLVWSAVLSGTVLLYYLATLSPGAFPGRSADLIVKALGLEPRLSPSQPVWFWLTGPLTSLKDAVGGLNAFSAVCGAVSVFLLSWLLMRAAAIWDDAGESDPAEERLVPRLAALTGGACLALTPVFWQASTRAHTGTLDALLLLLWGCLLLRYVQSQCLRWMYAFAALGGLGGVECVSFLWLAVPAFLGCGWLLHCRDQLSLHRLVALATTAAAAFALFTLLQAHTFIGTEGHRLTGALPLWRVVGEILRGHCQLLRQGVTLTGWLHVFLLQVLPWLACVGTLVSARCETRGPGTLATVGLNILFTLATLWTLLNAPSAIGAPYREQHQWLIPHVLSASVFGWLTAYWCRCAACAADYASPRLSQCLRSAVVAAVVLLLASGFWHNRRACDGRTAAAVWSYADAVLDTMGTRTWLLTGGNLDSSLQIAARTHGIPLCVVNVGKMRNELYRNYLANRFEDPQLGNACRLGLTPLIRDWFGHATNIAENVAVMSLPEVWYAAGLQPVPNQLTFVGASEQAQPSAQKVWKDHETAWERLAPLLAPNDRDQPFFAAFRRDSSRHASMVANNLGVWLEDRRETALAIQAYHRARALDVRNVSALLNLGSLAQRGLLTEDANMIRAEMAALATAKPKFDWWLLSRRFGYVRNPEAYVALGNAWALAGQAGIFAAGLRKASDLSPSPASETVLQTRLADIYAWEGRAEESRALYEQRLNEKPDDPAALLGLARLAVESRDYRAAQTWLARIDVREATFAGLGVDLATLCCQAGDPARARVIVQETIENAHDDLRAWVTLASIALGQQDEATLDTCAREIMRLEKGRGFHGAALAALRALAQGKYEAARHLLDETLRFRPRSVETLDRILRLDQMLGPRPSTEANARFLASLDSRNAVAPHTLGALSLQAGDYTAARPWLEKSVSLAPTPASLNDLAWTLLHQGDSAQAETHARAALALAPRFVAALDTLGMILSKDRKIDEAAQVFEQALRHGGRQPPVLIHLAQVRLSQGDEPAARTLVAEVEDAHLPLAPAESAALQAVRDALVQTAKQRP